MTYNGKRVHYYGKKDIFIIPSSVDDQNDVEKKHVYSPVQDEDKLHITKTMKITAVHEEGGELLPDGEYRNNRWQRIIVADEIKRVWWTVGNTNKWSSFSTYQGDLYFSSIRTEDEKRRCKEMNKTGDDTFIVSLADGFSLGEGKRSCPVDQYVDLLLCVETNTGTITRPVILY